MSASSVALFLPNLAGGGAERVMVTLSGLLARRGVATTLLLGRAIGPLVDELPDSVAVVDLGCERLRYAPRKLGRYLRAADTQCLISTLTSANVVALVGARLAGRRLPVIVRIANTFSVSNSRARGLNARVAFAIAGRTYRHAALLVAPSAGVAHDAILHARVPPDRLRVIPNPVVGDAVFAGAREKLDHPWFAEAQVPVILGCGRLESQKNFVGLVEAFARVCKQRRARLVILGQGSQRDTIEARARSLGVADAVALPGFDPNPYRWMARAAVFVLSSDHEGLPGALIQAMALGTPVVAVDCPSGPREVLRGGAVGRLVPMGDLPALADAIIGALDRPRPDIPAEAWAPYTSDKAADRYLEAVNEVVA